MQTFKGKSPREVAQSKHRDTLTLLASLTLAPQLGSAAWRSSNLGRSESDHSCPRLKATFVSGTDTFDRLKRDASISIFTIDILHRGFFRPPRALRWKEDAIADF
jgi:hypothetical protein